MTKEVFDKKRNELIEIVEKGFTDGEQEVTGALASFIKHIFWFITSHRQTLPKYNQVQMILNLIKPRLQ